MIPLTCIIVSHNKPQYIKQAINSVLSQSLTNWQAVLMDSGILYDDGYFNWVNDARINVIRTNETHEIRRTKAPAPWCFNESRRRNLVHGELVTYLCDDDVFYDNAFEVFVNYKKNNPHVDAMYASQDVCVHDGATSFPAGERRAEDIMGRPRGKQLDCVVDYMQFCHTLKIVNDHNIYWPEEKHTENHADGVFMDRIGDHAPVYPIDIKIGQNRRTAISTYTPYRAI
jgi:spore maturation protein CgeD